MPSARRIHEDALIQRFRGVGRSLRSAVPSGQLALGIGDDAALFRSRSGYETILSCDWFLEGTHFLRDKHPPNSVGWKCLARALSDIAAMGGIPRCYLLSLALPAALTGRWLDEFLRGLRRASHKFGCALAGGDTTRGDKILVNVTVVGEARTGCAIRRTGARAGDLLYVSGRLGEAAWGLHILKNSKRGSIRRGHPRLRKHLYPEPQLALGQWLAAGHLASSMMDISDGLSTDLARLCVASGEGARVELAKIPTVGRSKATRRNAIDSRQLALHGGDDYELLFTVHPRRKNLVPRAYRGVPLTCMGMITSERAILLVDENGLEGQLIPGGWDSFRVGR